MDRPDLRSPWVFDTRELVRRPGMMHEFSRTFALPDDIGTVVISMKAGSPVDLEARLESVVEGVLVTGSVSGRATGACVRCLDPVDRAVGGRFQELFAYADRMAHRHEVGDDDEDDEHEIVADLIDLENVVRDAVVPTLPFKPVCRKDCPGLCSECGIHLADDPGHQHDSPDPRWSELSKLLEADPQEKRN